MESQSLTIYEEWCPEGRVSSPKSAKVGLAEFVEEPCALLLKNDETLLQTASVSGPEQAGISTKSDKNPRQTLISLLMIQCS